MADTKNGGDSIAELHEPNFELQKKVGGKGALGKLFTAERVRGAQQVIEDFKTTYFEDISAHLAELHAAASGEIDRGPLLESVKALKGHAETLGFDFILQVCQPLYAFLSERETFSATDTVLIQKHAEAILAGVRKKERGKGGKVEQDTLQSLQILREKIATHSK